MKVIGKWKNTTERLLMSNPGLLRIPEDALGRRLSISDDMDLPRMARMFANKAHPPQSMAERAAKLYEGLFDETIVERFICPITEITRFRSPGSSESYMSCLDRYARIECADLVSIPSTYGLTQLLNSPDLRDSVASGKMSLVRKKWDYRLCLDNEANLDTFIATRYMAKRLGVEITLPFALKEISLSPLASEQFNEQFQAILINSKNPVDFNEMTSFLSLKGCHFLYQGLPESSLCLILLDRQHTASNEIGTELKNRGAFDFNDLLDEMLADQMVNIRQNRVIDPCSEKTSSPLMAA